MENIFVADANTGIEIRGNRAYVQTNAGGYWHDSGTVATLPMPRSKAQSWIDSYIRFAAGPTQQQMLDALTGSEPAVVCTGCGKRLSKSDAHYGDHADTYSGTVWHCDECWTACECQ